METYQVLMTEKAEKDMENLYNYIAVEDLAPEAAMAQYNRIAGQIMALSEMPARACLKNAFCQMCVTICGRLNHPTDDWPNEGRIAGYVT